MWAAPRNFALSQMCTNARLNYPSPTKQKGHLAGWPLYFEQLSLLAAVYSIAITTW